MPVTAVILKDFPPNYILKDGQRPAGFAIEVLDKIAASAGLKVTYVFKENWEEVSEALRSGQADLCPLFASSPSRLRGLEFTSSMATMPVRIVVLKTTHDIVGPFDLQHHNVGVIRGSAAWEFLRHRNDLSLFQIDKTGQALFELLTGQIEALVIPEQVIMAMARKAGVEDRIKIVGVPLFQINRAMAVRKGNTELLQRLEPAVRSFVDSREFHEVYTRWYGTPLTFWTPRRILWAMSGLLLVFLLFIAVWRTLSVTKIKRAEEAMREKERNLASIYQVSPAGIGIVIDRVINQVNDRLCFMMG